MNERAGIRIDARTAATRSRMRSLLLGLVIALAALPLQAGPDAIAQREIEHLIAQLGASGCEFNRNGTWYASSAARSHLQRKYDYLLKKNLVTTAETFIERGGSESSSSGKPYLVKCAGAAAIESGVWLAAELRRFRETNK
jgi:hypothetical protein